MPHIVSKMAQNLPCWLRGTHSILFNCVPLAYARLMRHSTSGILDSPQATDHRLGMEKAVRIR